MENRRQKTAIFLVLSLIFASLAFALNIMSPQEGSKYHKSTQQIGVSGNVNTFKEVPVEVVIIIDDVIYSSVTLTPDPMTGFWSGALPAPMGGWPVGEAQIRAIHRDGTPVYRGIEFIE
jgi:hypothetical protein